MRTHARTHARVRKINKFFKTRSLLWIDRAIEVSVRISI